MALSIDCDNPKEILKQLPCVSCISATQLLQLLVVVLNDYLSTLRGGEYYDLPTDLHTLMQDGACYGCMSESEQLQVMATFASWIAYGADGADVDFSERAQCILCADPKLIRGAILRLLCLISQQLNPVP